MGLTIGLQTKGLPFIVSWFAFAMLSTQFACHASNDKILSMRYRCGVNSAYLLLRLSGCEIEYDSLQINREPGREGVSIKDITTELARCGLPSTAYQCTGVEQFRKLPPPFIIYTNPEDYLQSVGHFLVVTKINSDTAEVIDGVTSERKHYALNKLENLWDGFVIVPNQNPSPNASLATAAMLGVLGVSLLCLNRVWHFVRSLSRVFLNKPFATCIFLQLSLAAFCCAGEVKLNRVANDGPQNVLYVFAKCHEIVVSQEQLVKIGNLLRASPDMQTMQEACASIDCPTRIARLDMNEVKSVPMPALILLGHEGSTSGEWSILVRVTKDNVAVVRGNKIIPDLVSMSEFRSQWNGLAIFKTESRTKAMLPYRIGSILVSAFVFLSLVTGGSYESSK